MEVNQYIYWGDNMLDDLTKKDIPESLKDIVDEIGIDNFIKLCRLCGGISIYIPTENSLSKPIRNRVIKKNFDGGNYKELARKFDISEVQVRKIVGNM
jgi:Mor family transcriptional regulator